MDPADDRDAILARFLEGPALLARKLDGLRDELLDAAPSKGGWTIRQIVHHIADGDDLWKVGIKAALGNPEGEFTLEWYWAQPQEVWAERWAYERRSVDASLALLEATRAHVRQLLECVPDGWNRALAIPTPNGKVERLSVGAIVEMQADHVVHHVARIDEILAEAGGAS
jgi:uncharacterized damage-inducible protein DinB